MKNTMTSIINEKNESTMKQYDYDTSIGELECLVTALEMTKCVVLDCKDIHNKKLVFKKVKTLARLTKICNEMIVDLQQLKCKVDKSKGFGRSNIYGNFEIVKISVFTEICHVEKVTGVSIMETLVSLRREDKLDDSLVKTCKLSK